MKTNEEYVEEFLFKLNRLTPAGGFMLENGNYGHGMLSEIFISDWLRTTLEEVRREERERIVNDLDNLMETLADIEHERWSKWQKYMHSKVIPSADDGISLIGTEFIDRWNRQIATPYIQLSEKEKESDREQVRPYLKIIKEFILTPTNQDKTTEI